MRTLNKEIVTLNNAELYARERNGSSSSGFYRGYRPSGGICAIPEEDPHKNYRYPIGYDKDWSDYTYYVDDYYYIK